MVEVHIQIDSQHIIHGGGGNNKKKNRINAYDVQFSSTFFWHLFIFILILLLFC